MDEVARLLVLKSLWLTETTSKVGGHKHVRSERGEPHVTCSFSLIGKQCMGLLEYLDRFDSCGEHFQLCHKLNQ